MSKLIRAVRAAAVVGLTLAGMAGVAHGQARPGATPGEFDFYVLALSWSPSYCEAQGERVARSIQCGGERPYSFVVHGLWPQFQRGFPEYCQVPAPELDRRTINTMLDIMPAPGLVRQQWAKHGTCAGSRSPGAFFELVRQARAKVRIPAEYEGLAAPKMVSPDEVEEAFVRVNQGLTREMISVQCDQQRLREVRICIGRDMNFTACQEVDRRTCRRDRLVMPPTRPARS
jgi:ribonuclease T2